MAEINHSINMTCGNTDGSSCGAASNGKRHVVIFDTTLRDGEQSPGASMNREEKLEVAQMLAKLGVDVIEAGFPVASPGDFESVRSIAQTIKGTSVCGLARCREKDITTAWEAIQSAENPRIHVFLATSPIHRQYKLRMTKEQIIENAVAGVKLARSFCDNIEFSAEDGSRTEIDFLCEVTEAVIRAGASTVNIPDTVGYAVPTYVKQIFESLCNRVPNIDRAILSTHNHNDLGLATANSMAAIEGGCGQVECTVNGLGERAGNSPLEEIVMALRTRGDYFNADTRINSKLLVPASKLVSRVTGLSTPRNKAIVGRNAFAHESGIHQDGILKERTTYEIMRPEDVGFTKTDLVLGKHSGRAALVDRARQMGYALTPEQLDVVYSEFKILADKKKEVYDEDLRSIIDSGRAKIVPTWNLESYSCICSTDGIPEVVLKLRRCTGEIVRREVHDGDGPVDALFIALKEIVGYNIQCVEYKVSGLTVGHDAQGEVVTQLKYNDQLYRGKGVSTDSAKAAVLAFLDAVNRIEAVRFADAAQPSDLSQPSSDAKATDNPTANNAPAPETTVV